MKRRTVFLGVLVLSIFLPACGPNVGGLSDKEIGQVAEYAAKIGLKHIQGYDPTLMEEMSVKENPGAVKEDFEKAGEPKDSKNTPSNQNPNNTDENTSATSQSAVTSKPDTSVSLNDMLSEDGFEVTYKSSGRHSRYPKNEGYFSLVAGEGRELYVVEFTIKNKTNKDKSFKKIEGTAYSLTFDENNFYKPCLTFLENDMQSIDISVKAGKTIKAVLVFDIKKSEKTGAKLNISKGTSSHEFDV